MEFCQDNESMSSYGVMRGLHFQRPPFTQSKLVRCVKGRVIIIPSFKRAALGNLKASFHCTHWHRFFPLKKAFSKTYPSFLTLKEGSTFLTKPLFPQGREDVTALRCSEPLRYKVGGPSKVSPDFAGWDRLGVHILNIIVVHILNVTCS